MNDLQEIDRAEPQAKRATASGVFAAALTPMNADLSPDMALMGDHCRWLLQYGCDGLAILGTTGEANSFSVEERIAIMETLAEQGIPADKLLPGTGCCAIPDTVRLCKKALELGTKGVLALPPFYYKNVSDDGLFAHFSQVIDQVGDGRLRLYVYNFPQMSATPISYDLIGRLRARYPQIMAGMKDSSGDIDNMCGAAKAFPGFSVFSGADPLLLPLMKAGGVGCITACCNVMPDLLVEIYTGWRDGAADRAHGMAGQVRTIVSSYPPIAALKALMARHTGIDQWLNARPPLVPLTGTQRVELYQRMDDSGYRMLPL